MSVANHALTEVQLYRTINQGRDFATKSPISLHLLGVKQFVVANVSDPATNGLVDGAVATEDKGEDQGEGANKLAEFVDVSGGSMFHSGAACYIHIREAFPFGAL